MTTFVQEGAGDIRTALPSTQPIKKSTVDLGKEAVTAAVGLGLELYKEDVRSDVRSGVNDALKATLGEEEQPRTATDVASQAFAESLTKSPDVEVTEKQLTKIGAAARQGKGSELMLRLRAEKALKEGIRRAPGMRRELAGIAQSILGFDPSGSLINAMVRAETGEAEDKSEWYQRDLSEALTRFGVATPMITPGLVDIPEAEALLVQARADAKLEEEARDNIKNAAKQAPENELSASIDYLQKHSKTLSNRLKPALDAAVNMLSDPNMTWEEFQRTKPSLTSELTALENTVAMSMRNAAEQVELKYGENDPKFRAALDARVKSVTSGMRSILESADSTEFEQRTKLFDVLVNKFKLDFATANETLSRINAGMPGAAAQAYAAVLATDFRSQDLFKDLIKSGVINSSPEAVEQLNMLDHLDSLENIEKFKDKSAEQRKAAADRSAKFLSERLSIPGGTFDDAPDLYANAFATIAQTMNVNSGKDTENIIPLLTDKRLPEMIDSMIESGGNNVISSEVVADSVIQSLSKYLAGYGASKAAFYSEDPEAQVIGGTPRPVGLRYDTQEGKFTTYQKSVLGVTGTAARAEADAVASRLNASLDTLERLKKHDPSISELSRAQIGQMVVVRNLRRAGAEVTGGLVEMPEFKTQREEDKVTQQEALDATLEELREIRKQLQGG